MTGEEVADETLEPVIIGYKALKVAEACLNGAFPIVEFRDC